MQFLLEETEISGKRKKELNLYENFKIGNMKILFISNFDKTTDKRILVKLKFLFQKQLSKMPKEYIMRQIFDEKHICLVILNNFNNIIGGICFRPFYQQKFYEIVFCAVDSNYQIKGIGSFLMDLLKQYAKVDFTNYFISKNNTFKNLYINSLDYLIEKNYIDVGNIYFITYADNFAIGYFKKQGFRTKISFDSWIGYIKDYEGGTIMECLIFWEIDYINKSNILKTKKENFIDKLKKTTDFYKTYTYNDESNIRKIPGIKDDMNINKDRRGRDECLKGFIELMMGILRNDPNSWPFLDPVSAKDIPEYYEIIKSPMDLSKIREKFRNNIYKSLDLFISDVHLMLNNCFKFNARETQYYRCAEVLFTLFEEKLKFYENSIKYWEF